jgi:hypothetical protein
MGWELGEWSVIGVLRMSDVCKEEAPAKERCWRRVQES